MPSHKIEYVFQTDENLGYWTDYLPFPTLKSAEECLAWYNRSGYPLNMLRIIRRETIEEALVDYKISRD